MMGMLSKLFRLFLLGVTAYAVYEQMQRNPQERDWKGTVLFVPYDLRFPPSPARILSRWWNPDDERILTPMVFGAGWSINLYRLREEIQASAKDF